MKLEDENIKLRQELALAQAKQGQPEEVVRAILGRDISWYDYQKLDKQNWLNYYNDIQQVVNSESFNNEVMHFLKDMMEKGFTESADIDQLIDYRTGFVFMETFLERLRKIERPDIIDKEVEEPFEAI